MKTIVIPTDFSIPSKNAAQYGVKLAKILKGDIVLCHAYAVPAEVPMAGTIVWPIMESSEIEEEIRNDLAMMINELSASSCEVDHIDYTPMVNYDVGKGDVCEVIATVVKKREADLVVMGMTGRGAVNQFLLGSSSKKMIEKASFPLLLIPPHTSFKDIKKIVFTTSLDKKDLKSLAVVASFAKALDAEVLINYIINKEAEQNDKLQLKIDDFLKLVAETVSYHKIKYEHIWDLDVDSGLDWIATQGDVDMVAMTHYKHNILEKIFSGSHTKKLSRNIKVPLMVFPD